MNLLFLLGCVIGVAGAAHAAPGATSVRLVAVGKAEATLSVDLDAPGSVSVSWGESPGAWAESAESAAAETHHQLLIPHLVPDTRYFYQVSVDGEPHADMFTFRSGRSWVTRRASLLITADLPQGSSGETALAERLFAEESDALILLGAAAAADGDGEAALRALHSRSMAEKVVVVASDAGATRLDVADVRVISDGVLPSTDDGNCWRVALGTRAPAGAEVTITRGPSPSIVASAEGVHITLTDPELSEAATNVPRAYARLDFAEGRLLATLHSEGGASLGKAELTRACHAPAPKEPVAPLHSADGEDEPGTSDGDADVSDCVLK